MQELLQQIADVMGFDATIEDAEHAYIAAEDWYNATPTSDILDWYSGWYADHKAYSHAKPLFSDCGLLVPDWNEIVIFARATTL